MVGKFHLLVVDDDPDKRSMLELALAAEGYEVHTPDSWLMVAHTCFIVPAVRRYAAVALRGF